MVFQCNVCTHTPILSDISKLEKFPIFIWSYGGGKGGFSIDHVISRELCVINALESLDETGSINERHLIGTT